MSAKPAEEYVAKALRLTSEEVDILLARMQVHYSRRMQDARLSKIEALALQLQFEDEDLLSWRTVMAELRAKSDAL